MIRKLRSFGLALLAVTCLGGLAAASSSAALFHSEAAPTSVKLTSTGIHTFAWEGGAVNCKAVEFNGSMSSKTVETIDLEAFYYYTTCDLTLTEIGTFINMTISQNGCHFILNANGQVTIKCPTAKGIEFEFGGLCTVKMLPQAATSATFVNNEKDVAVSFALKNLSYSTSGVLCEGGSGTNGTYTGNTTAVGRNSGGTQVRFWHE